MTDPVVNSIISKMPNGDMRLVVMVDGLVHDIFEGSERNILNMQLELLVGKGIIADNWRLVKKTLNVPK